MITDRELLQILSHNSYRELQQKIPTIEKFANVIETYHPLQEKLFHKFISNFGGLNRGNIYAMKVFRPCEDIANLSRIAKTKKQKEQILSKLHQEFGEHFKNRDFIKDLLKHFPEDSHQTQICKLITKTCFPSIPHTNSQKEGKIAFFASLFPKKQQYYLLHILYNNFTNRNLPQDCELPYGDVLKRAFTYYSHLFYTDSVKYTFKNIRETINTTYTQPHAYYAAVLAGDKKIQLPTNAWLHIFNYLSKQDLDPQVFDNLFNKNYLRLSSHNIIQQETQQYLAQITSLGPNDNSKVFQQFMANLESPVVQAIWSNIEKTVKEKLKQKHQHLNDTSLSNAVSRARYEHIPFKDVKFESDNDNVQNLTQNIQETLELFKQHNISATSKLLNKMTKVESPLKLANDYIEIKTQQQHNNYLQKIDLDKHILSYDNSIQISKTIKDCLNDHSQALEKGLQSLNNLDLLNDSEMLNDLLQKAQANDSLTTMTNLLEISKNLKNIQKATSPKHIIKTVLDDDEKTALKSTITRSFIENCAHNNIGLHKNTIQTLNKGLNVLDDLGILEDKSLWDHLFKELKNQIQSNNSNSVDLSDNNQKINSLHEISQILKNSTSIDYDPNKLANLIFYDNDRETIALFTPDIITFLVNNNIDLSQNTYAAIKNQPINFETCLEKLNTNNLLDANTKKELEKQLMHGNDSHGIRIIEALNTIFEVYSKEQADQNLNANNISHFAQTIISHPNPLVAAQVIKDHAASVTDEISDQLTKSRILCAHKLHDSLCKFQQKYLLPDCPTHTALTIASDDNKHQLFKQIDKFLFPYLYGLADGKSQQNQRYSAIQFATYQNSKQSFDNIIKNLAQYTYKGDSYYDFTDRLKGLRNELNMYIDDPQISTLVTSLNSLEEKANNEGLQPNDLTIDNLFKQAFCQPSESSTFEIKSPKTNEIGFSPY